MALGSSLSVTVPYRTWRVTCRVEITSRVGLYRQGPNHFPKYPLLRVEGCLPPPCPPARGLCSPGSAPKSLPRRVSSGGAPITSRPVFSRRRPNHFPAGCGATLWRNPVAQPCGATLRRNPVAQPCGATLKFSALGSSLSVPVPWLWLWVRPLGFGFVSVRPCALPHLTGRLLRGGGVRGGGSGPPRLVL